MPCSLSMTQSVWVSILTVTCLVGVGEEGLVGGGGWRACEELFVGPHLVGFVVRDGGIGNTGVMSTTWIILVHLIMRRIPGGANKTSALQECLVGSRVFAEGVGCVCARLLCLSIPRNPKVSQTFIADHREPRLSES